MSDLNVRYGTWSVPGQTQTAGTAIAIPIPPWRGGQGNTPFVYGLDSQGTPNWTKNGAYTHVTNYGIVAGGTAHKGVFMRPLNYSVVTVAGAANGTTFTIGTDPGLYTTAANWKISSVTPKGVATNAIANTDYFAVQLTDGTWFFDKVSSMSTLQVTCTTTIPNITGGGIPVGAIMFFFGSSTDLDPRMGAGSAHPSISANVSATLNLSDPNGSIATTLGPGEPMYYLNLNATAADTVSNISGFFGKF